MFSLKERGRNTFDVAFLESASPVVGRSTFDLDPRRRGELSRQRPPEELPRPGRILSNDVDACFRFRRSIPADLLGGRSASGSHEGVGADFFARGWREILNLTVSANAKRLGFS